MEVDRIVAELTAEALAPASSAPVGGIRRPANNAAVTSVSNIDSIFQTNFSFNSQSYATKPYTSRKRW